MVNLGIRDLNIGDWIVIKEYPGTWSSLLNGKCPGNYRNNDVKYPFLCKIENISVDNSCFNANGYGFTERTKFRKATDEEILTMTLIINDFPVF